MCLFTFFKEVEDHFSEAAVSDLVQGLEPTVNTSDQTEERGMWKTVYCCHRSCTLVLGGSSLNKAIDQSVFAQFGGSHQCFLYRKSVFHRNHMQMEMVLIRLLRRADCSEHVLGWLHMFIKSASSQHSSCSNRYL